MTAKMARLHSHLYAASFERVIPLARPSANAWTLNEAEQFDARVKEDVDRIVKEKAVDDTERSAMEVERERIKEEFRQAMQSIPGLRAEIKGTDSLSDLDMRNRDSIEAAVAYNMAVLDSLAATFSRYENPLDFYSRISTRGMMFHPENGRLVTPAEYLVAAQNIEEREWERANEEALRPFWERVWHRIDPASLKADWPEDERELRSMGLGLIFQPASRGGIAIDEIADELERAHILPEGGGADALIEKLKGMKAPRRGWRGRRLNQFLGERGAAMASKKAGTKRAITPEAEHTAWEQVQEDTAEWGRQVKAFDPTTVIKGGKTKNLTVGNTPDVLQQLGANNLPMTMSYENLAKILSKKQDHNLPKALVAQLPMALADPIMVFESATEPDAFVVLTELEHEGRSVMVAVHLNKQKQNIMVNDIASAYKRNSDWYLGQIEDGRLLYQNKNKSLAWARTHGLQLPKVRRLPTGLSRKKLLTDEDVVKPVRHPELVNKSYESVEAVRAQYEGTDAWMKAPNGKPTNLTEQQWLQVRTPEFKKWFGDWENDTENASKVVDENGEPLVAYHGTSPLASFEVFRESPFGSMGPGSYFTTKKEKAQSYSRRHGAKSGEENVYEVFLNIREPLSLENPYAKRSHELGEHDGILAGDGDGGFEIVVSKPEQIKSATDNVSTFNENNPNIFFQNPAERQARGYVEIAKGHEYTIQLLQHANLSTLLHETGHIALSEMERLIEMGVADARLIEDYQKIREYLGLQEGDNLADGANPRMIEANEKFAKAWELYLREGKAPSAKLESAFSRFKRWLLRIYKSVVNNPYFKGVELNEDIRGVFDRLLATDDEIRRAAEKNGLSDDLKAELDALGLSGNERAQITSLIQAQEQAADNLQKARDAGRLAKLNEWRKKAHAIIETEPEYRALRLLRANGIDADAVVQLVGEDMKNRLVKRLPGVKSREGGASPESIAWEAGFSTPEEMIQAVVNYPKALDRVRELVDAMQEEHDAEFHAEDYLYDTDALAASEEQLAQAIDKIMRKARYQGELAGRTVDGVTVEPTEEEYMDYGPNAQQVASRETIKRHAEESLQKTRNKDALSPWRFRAAVRRYVNEERRALMRQDWMAAQRANYQLRLNMELARQAEQLRQNMEKFQAKLKQFLKNPQNDPNARYSEAEHFSEGQKEGSLSAPTSHGDPL